MKSPRLPFLLIFILLLSVPRQALTQSEYNNHFSWSEYPELPPPSGAQIQLGVASPFAGTNGEVLIVAGGCNFPDHPVREGGMKKYYDDAFVFIEREGSWQWLNGFKIPKPTAYGASVSLPEGLLCIGGNGSDSAFNDVYLLEWKEESSALEVEVWPSLPYSMTQMGAALIDEIVYVVGGQTSGVLASTFLSLDLSKRGTELFQWKILEFLPAPAWFQPVVVDKYIPV
jgi:N-acetylneuraminic acid mutarotase